MNIKRLIAFVTVFLLTLTVASTAFALPANPTPSFSLVSTKGNVVSNDSLRGKTQVLIFGRAACVNTTVAVKAANALAPTTSQQVSYHAIYVDNQGDNGHRSYMLSANPNVQFVFHDQQPSPSAAINVLSAFARAYNDPPTNSWPLPVIVILDPSGTVIDYSTGYVSAAALRTRVNQALTVQSATINASEKTLEPAQSFQLTLTTLPTQVVPSAIQWSSSNPAVATVDANGKVTAVRDGSAVITASVQGISKTCTVTVASQSAAITLSATSLALTVGKSSALTATVSPAAQAVQWSSSNPAVATVDANGTVKAVRSGTATIKASVQNASASCTVTVSPRATGIALSRKTATLYAGKSVTLKAKIAPKGASTTMQWKSSNPAVATVDTAGRVKALKPGTAIISAITKDGSNKKASCKITVPRVRVSQVKLSKKTVALAPGKSYRLKSAISPSNASNKKLVWKSSNSKVVKVDSKGRITARKKGSVIITAYAADGSKRSAQCRVVVR